ncbi:MAG: hypothetical protein KKF62_11040 [Bacteroidetes bacterium]|nr:hypothetical protein [Bacteroidota bacterium]MBU1115290.1 hypothetical protein [Bacteroidota bacterium]MBU1800154.1 hypothetical protein [Bacteroidota bacterium]
MNILSKISLIIVTNFFVLNFSISYALPPAKSGDSIGNRVPITGDIQQLKYFFNALEKTNSEKIRIAHFGDSIIWGDVISDNLRVNLQKKYGGHGIGFISICNDDLAARKTIAHEFSDDWDWASVFTKNRDRYPIGIAGTVAKASSKSTVSYKTNNNSPAANSFSDATLFYSNANSNSSVSFKINNEVANNTSLSGGKSLNKTELNFKKDVKEIELEFSQCKDAYFYGITLDSGNGVYVDNFPFRGNSGVSMRDLDDDLLAGFSKELNYKLIILQFGVNIAASGNIKYKWYSNMMLHVIKKLKKYFPGTSILMISPGDLGQKQGRKIITHPEIEKFVKVQEEIANTGGVAFWNMFEAMGGENSIANWVEATPPLAFKDFCHLTGEGGEIISDKLVVALMEIKSKIK